MELRLPGLADRRDDILPLAMHFLADGKRLSEDAERALLAHAWPGNVRELRNAIQRAGLLSAGEWIDAAALDLPRVCEPGHPLHEPDAREIESALRRHHGVIAQAAAELGLSRQSLYRRMERLGIARP